MFRRWLGRRWRCKRLDEKSDGILSFTHNQRRILGAQISILLCCRYRDYLLWINIGTGSPDVNFSVSLILNQYFRYMRKWFKIFSLPCLRKKIKIKFLIAFWKHLLILKVVPKAALEFLYGIFFLSLVDFLQNTFISFQDHRRLSENFWRFTRRFFTRS